MTVALYGETFAIDARFHNSIGGLEEVITVRLYVEPDQVGAQESVHEFSLPRANAECLLVGPRNVPENCHPSIASSLFDKPGQQREMVVLHQNHRVNRAFHLFDDSVSELVVDSLVMLPIIGPEDRPGVRDVAERPKPLIGKPVVVALLFIFGEPYPPQRVLRILWRYAQTIMVVNRFHVGITAAVSDPCSVAGAEHRFECGYQSTGRNANFQEFATPGVHIGLTIGDHEKSPVSQTGANMNGEPVGRPLGLSLLA